MDQAAIEAAIAKSLSEGLSAKLGEVVNEKLEAKFTELGMNKNAIQHGMFPGIMGGDEKAALALSKKERVAEFIKAVYRKDVGKLAEMNSKAMTEQVGSAGGFTVPEEFMGEVLRIAEDFGLMRKFARKIGMKRDTMNAASLATSVTAYWPGEGNAGTESQPVLARPELQAKTLVGLSTMSQELLEDTDIDMVDFLMTIFGEAFAGEEDQQGFNGTGAPFTGILVDSGVTVLTMASGQDTFAETLIDDLVNMRGQVKSSVLPTCAYYMHRLTWSAIQNIKQNSQSIITFQNPMASAFGPDKLNMLMPVGSIGGWPVYLSDKLPSTTAVSTKFIVFGSLPMGMLFGDRKQVTLKIAEEATVGSANMFERNMAAARLTERVGLVVAQPTCFVALKTAAS